MGQVCSRLELNLCATSHCPHLLPLGRPKERSIVGECLGDGCVLRIKIIREHSVAPPVWEVRATDSEGESSDGNDQGGTNVQRTR